MPKRTEATAPHQENPEWTKERVSKAMRLSDLPHGLQQTLAPRKTRGPQKKLTKQIISIRLSPDVLAAVRSTGEGWQTRVDEALRETLFRAAQAGTYEAAERQPLALCPSAASNLYLPRRAAKVRNLFDPVLVDETKRRILLLQPESEAQWGTLAVAQALAHCTSGIEMAMGAIQAKRAQFPTDLIGLMIKPLVFRDDKPLRRNSPSSPELFALGSTKLDFVSERSRVIAAIDRFALQGPVGCSRYPHPFFGSLNPQQWAILMYKHLDHHLRQFGA